ncbi:MAG: hypothetical protein IJL95_09370 [Solobacterium sp.]|nr:hypothetical protein [Solobacterium sp.]
MKHELTFLQKQQVELARLHGLEDEQIRQLADYHYNYRQMEQLRLAMEEDTDPHILAVMMHPWVRARDMEDIRYRASAGQPIDHYRRPVPWRRLGICAFGLLAAGCGLVLVHGTKREKPVLLELRAAEITLACGQSFRPEDYIRQPEDLSAVQLPEAFEAYEPGNYLAEYVLRKDPSVHAYLRIRVADEAAPSIVLNAEQAVMAVSGEPECRQYLAEVSDNVDGDLLRQTACSYDAEKQEIVFRVKDRAGNTAEAVLPVRAAEETEAPVMTEEQTSGTPDTILHTGPLTGHGTIADGYDFVVEQVQ